ncbi:major facilitator superfamily domain-containing protein [Fennellomyces sp. T-0311]|nr:major facilitator superfamily domain-containing protein [Fennellomyces sp. T-0311]
MYIVPLGVISDLLQRNVFGSTKKNTMLLSFVGSMAPTIMQLCVFLFRILEIVFGLKKSLAIGTVLYFIGMLSAGFSSQIWQLYLSLSICSGCGGGALWLAAYRVTPQWFNKRRGLAMGIVASGSGLCGLIIPFIATGISKSSLGVYWNFRILAIVFLFLDIFVCIVMRERPVQRQLAINTSGPNVNFKVLKNGNFVLWIVACIPQALVSQLPFQIVPSYGTYLGLTELQNTSLIAIMSGLNIIGRILQGAVADRIGSLNTVIITSIICALGCFFIWTFAMSYTTILVFSIIYGLFSGAFYVATAPCIVHFLGVEEVATGTTFFWCIVAIPLMGPSLASAIEMANHGRPFLAYQLFSGLCFVVSIIILAILKFRLDRKVLARV